MKNMLIKTHVICDHVVHCCLLFSFVILSHASSTTGYPSCTDPPPSAPNATLHTKEREHGTHLIYICDTYFRKLKYGSITCQFGKWIGTLPVCSDTRCYVDALEDYNVLTDGSNVTFHGSYFYPKCKDGFVLNEEGIKIRCQHGEWEIAGQICEPKNCTEFPPKLKNGHIESFSTRHNSTIAVYSCNSGYRFKYAAFFEIRCMYGKWEGSLSECIKSDVVINLKAERQSIEIKQSPSGVFYLQPSYKYEIFCYIRNGTHWPRLGGPRLFKIRYLIPRGKVPTVSLTIPKMSEKYNGKYTCDNRQGDSNFIEIEANDDFLECPEITDIAEGLFVRYHPDRKVGSRAYFSCGSIDTYNSNQSVLCLDNGTWSTIILPTCEYGELTWCTMDSLRRALPENVVPVQTESEAVPYYKSEIELACLHDYFNPVGTATCGKDGSWIIPVELCAIGCSPIPITKKLDVVVEPLKPFYNFGEHVTFSCRTGKTLDSDVQRIICLDGGWSHTEFPSCI